MRKCIGDTRQKKGFLLFPLTINDEERWLERATWEETYQDSYCIGGLTGGMTPIPKWVPTKWINE